LLRSTGTWPSGCPNIQKRICLPVSPVQVRYFCPASWWPSARAGSASSQPRNWRPTAASLRSPSRAAMRSPSTSAGLVPHSYVRPFTSSRPTRSLSRNGRQFYDQQRGKDKRHHAIVRSLAFKWIRVLFRCWKDRTPYVEQRYLEALQQRRGPN
jgi:hypothetical protein